MSLYTDDINASIVGLKDEPIFQFVNLILKIWTDSSCSYYDYFIAGLSLHQSSPIVITSVNVPKYGVAGQEVVLGCNYRADSMVYSVRWYKNGKEFYRLAPNRKCRTL